MAPSVELRRRVLRTRTASAEGLELPHDSAEHEIPFQVSSLEQHDSHDKHEVKEKLSNRLPSMQPINWKFVGALTVAAYMTRFFKIWAGAFVLYKRICFPHVLMHFYP